MPRIVVIPLRLLMSEDASTKPESPSVVLIEDETVFRQLLRRALEKRKGWLNISDYPDGISGLQACLDNPPDLLLVDLHLPGKHGLDIVRELRPVHPNVRIMVLTGFAEPKLPSQLMSLGVAGFVDKAAPLAYVLQAIDTVMAGGTFFAPYVQVMPSRRIRRIYRPRVRNLPRFCRRESWKLLV
jgi:DNA-binding NarL/FixJ family response regulator